MAIKARETITIIKERDVNATWRFYRLAASTSTPSQPTEAQGKAYVNNQTIPTGWSLTEPAYSGASTNSLYTCDLTSFTDGEVSWSTVSKSSSYEAAKQAYNEAQEAKKTATNYMSADSMGIMIADQRDGSQSPSTATGRNVLIDSDSVDVRAGQTVLASFGETCRVGIETGFNIKTQDRAFTFNDGNDALMTLRAYKNYDGYPFGQFIAESADKKRMASVMMDLDRNGYSVSTYVQAFGENGQAALAINESYASIGFWDADGEIPRMGFGFQSISGMEVGKKQGMVVSDADIMLTAGCSLFLTGRYAGTNRIYADGDDTQAGNGGKNQYCAYSGHNFNKPIYVGGKKILARQTFNKDNFSVAASSYEGGNTLSVAKTGYTPIGITGWWINNASNNGTGASQITPYAIYLDGTNVKWSVRNRASSAAKIKFNVQVLFVSSDQGL